MKLFKLWVPVVVWAGVIFFFSNLPDLKTQLEYDFLLRKIAHILEYLMLTLLLYRAFKGSFKLNAWRLFAYPALIAFLYAVSDEIHQSFVPGRNCAFNDVLIDTIGILGFYIIVNFILNKSVSMTRR